MPQNSDQVARNRLFQGLAKEEINEVLAFLEAWTKSFRKDEFLYRAGEALDDVGIILEGQVVVSKMHRTGMRFIFAELPKNYLLGEVIFQSPEEESRYDAMAKEDTRILFLKATKIKAIRKVGYSFHGRFMENLLFLVLQKHRVFFEKMDLISRRSIRERIWYYLTLYAEKTNSRCLQIPFSRNELAEYLNVDRSALSRELYHMAEMGLIRFSKNEFELLEEDFLES